MILVFAAAHSRACCESMALLCDTSLVLWLSSARVLKRLICSVIVASIFSKSPGENLGLYYIWLNYCYSVQLAFLNVMFVSSSFIEGLRELYRISSNNCTHYYIVWAAN